MAKATLMKPTLSSVEADESRICLQSPFVKTKLRNATRFNSENVKPCLFVHERIGEKKRDVS